MSLTIETLSVCQQHVVPNKTYVWWVCGRCVMGVWWVCGGCVVGVWWVCGGCVVGVWWVCGGCVVGVWWVCGGCVVCVWWVCDVYVGGFWDCNKIGFDRNNWLQLYYNGSFHVIIHCTVFRWWTGGNIRLYEWLISHDIECILHNKFHKSVHSLYPWHDFPDPLDQDTSVCMTPRGPGESCTVGYSGRGIMHIRVSWSILVRAHTVTLIACLRCRGSTFCMQTLYFCAVLIVTDTRVMSSNWRWCQKNTNDVITWCE